MIIQRENVSMEIQWALFDAPWSFAKKKNEVGQIDFTMQDLEPLFRSIGAKAYAELHSMLSNDS